MLLQAVGWMGQFRTFAETRKESVGSVITDMEPSSASAESESKLTHVFANLGSKAHASAAHIMHLALNQPDRQAFLSTVTKLTLAKADEVHYYKYLAALLEDIPHVSPEWQPHLVAAAAYYAKASTTPILAKSARAALSALA